MNRMAIIADNLIGANDAGVQFKKSGLSVQVVTNCEEIPECCGDAEIISVNTNSRKIPPQEAYDRVSQTGKTLLGLGFEHFYKKIDSTLRGNVAEEIEAMMESLSINVAVIAPSYPVHGRIVENGYLELIQNWGENSVPVPICYIPSIVTPDAGMPAAVLTLADIREGEAALIQKITEIVNSGVRLIVTDAALNEDLDIIALAITNLNIPILAVGSAGLAGSLSGVWRSSAAEPLNLRQGTMIITGTLNQTTAEQINDIITLPNVELIDIKSNLIYEDKADDEFKRIVSSAQVVLAAGKIPAIVVDTLLENRDDVRALSLSAQVQKFGGQINSLLGLAARDITAGCCLRNLVVLGDGTVTSICEALKIQKINLVRELLPGIPLGRVSGGGADGIYLITKAGGFGEPASLRKILELL